jgi:thiol-disulfide isomerase/thioredoxin
VQLGSRLSGNSDASPSIANSFLLGIGTGLLWAPCAGPILGLILTGAALGGASAGTVLLLLAYAAGAATSLAIALFAGGRFFAALKHSLGAEEWIRRILGVAVLAGVVVVAFGLDRSVLTRLSLASTSGLEQTLLERFRPTNNTGKDALTQAINAGGDLDAGPKNMPDLSGSGPWIDLANLANSPALTPAALHGKVVLVDFWTYSCINCLRTLPYLKAWNDKYKNSGLVIIGVHTPEFPFEKDEGNVRKAVHDLGITYPIVMDNDYRIWRAFGNEYWPADYFIDAKGHIRYHHFGEGGYDESETWIRGLLKDATQQPLPGATTRITASGAEAPSDSSVVQSPETYIGYDRAKNFASPGTLGEDSSQAYEAPATLARNQWALAGTWLDSSQIATLGSPTGSIEYRFHARDLHLVLGPAKGGKPVRFRITIDGKPPGADHGVDTDANGNGAVKENRLYQLIRQRNAIQDRTFRIEFLDPGVQAFAFTFG